MRLDNLRSGMLKQLAPLPPGSITITTEKDPPMQIIEVHEANAVLLKAINALLPQLSEKASKLALADLQRIIDAEGSRLLAAVEGDRVLGCLALSVFPVLTDIRGWIDDLVVCASARRRGIGRQLVSQAINTAKEMGARSINLTCSSHRKQANSLYRKMGFRQRETNVYCHAR